MAFLQLVDVPLLRRSPFSPPLLGCSGRGAQILRGTVDPERQSEAEYDVARDYFYKGQPRPALEHCRKAIEFDDQNAKALYFASTIYLFFCSGKLELNDPDCRLHDAETMPRAAP